MAGRLRLRRWLVVVLAVLALPVLAWCLLGDVLVVAAVNRRLPHQLDDHLVLVRAHTAPPSTPAALVLELTPGRARRLARAAANQAIPPTVLRAGMTVEARWSGLEGGDPLALRAQLTATAEPPLARAVLSAALVNALVERHHRSEQAGLSVTYDYRLDPGSVLVDAGAPVAITGGWRRHFRATASGEIEAVLGGDRCLVRVSYVEVEVDLDLLRGDAGWRLRGDVVVGRCESQIVECRSVLLRMAAGGLPQVLETLLDQALAEDNLAEVRLPEWFPYDIRLDGRLE